MTICHTMSAKDNGGEKTVTFRWDEEKVEKLDDKIIEMKYEGEADNDYTRSDYIKELLNEEIDC